MIKSMMLGAALACLAGCSSEAAPPAEGDVAEAEQELIISCSPENETPCSKRGMICDYGHGYCVFVCDDGEACPTHRPCCN